MKKTTQRAYALDKLSLQKIGKGLLLAMSGPALLGGLQFLQAIELTDPNLAALYAACISVLANVVKEFIKGK